MNNILTKIKIHPLFWLTILIGIVTASFKEIMLLFCIVFVHELGHAIIANYFGWRIKKIELLPFGGVAEVEEYGNKPLKEEIMVILAGPLQHVWIFLLCISLFQFELIDEKVYLFLFFNNLSILFFNLLPIWPLDGGKLLFTLLSMKYTFVEAHKKMFISSCVFLIIFICIVLWISATNISMWFMILFLIVSLWKEWKQRNYIFIRFLLGRSNENSGKLKVLSLTKEEKLFDIFYLFQRGVRHEIIVGNNYFDEKVLIDAFFVEKILNIRELIRK